jgi:hypothetical protein
LPVNHRTPQSAELIVPDASNRQRLTFGFESCQCLARVHSQFDDLQSNSPTHRFRLLCHVDLAETAFTDLFEQLVATNRVTRLFPDPDRIRMLFRLLEPDGGVCQKCTAVLVSPQQRTNLVSQHGILNRDFGQSSVAVRFWQIAKLFKHFLSTWMHFEASLWIDGCGAENLFRSTRRLF